MIQIDSEFKALIPALSDDEYSQLEINLLRDGCRDPLVLWGDILLDGHNRYAICQRHGLSFETVQMSFDSRDDATLWIIRNQFGRRNLTPYVRGELALVMKGVIAAQAKANQISGLMRGNELPVLENSPKRESINTRLELAKASGLSDNTIARIEKIAQVAPPETREALRRGDVSINQVYQDIKKQEKVEARQETRPVVVDTLPPTVKPIIYHASADNMPIDDDMIDIIITSPPYNMGHNVWNMGGQGATPRLNGIGYNDDMPEDDYQDWQIACLNEMYRVSKQGASLFYNHKDRNRDGCLISPMEWLLRKDNQWTLRQVIVWDRKSTHNHNASYFYPETEYIYWLTKGKPTLPQRPIGMSCVWREPFVSGTWHPAPFTEALPKMLLDAIGRKEQLIVLDPFMGSGTTLKVALQYGYTAIGIDINAEYIQTTKDVNQWN